MTRLTIFYFLNWLALLVYIFNGSIYLSRGDMGAFQILMAFNTSLFLVIVIKAVTKGISKLFQSDEYVFRYLAIGCFVFTYILSLIHI